MAKIIPFRQHNKQVVSSRPQSCEGLRGMIGDLIPGLEQEFSAIGIEICPTLEIQAFLSTLGGVVSKNAIATSRQNLRSMSVEDLREIARNSNRIQWASRPGYFRALVDEIQFRK